MVKNDFESIWIDDYARRVFSDLFFEGVGIQITHTEKHPVLDFVVLTESGCVFQDLLE